MAVCYCYLNNNFQCLNNITRIFTHFFTHTYFKKNTNNIIRNLLPNGSEITETPFLNLHANNIFIFKFVDEN